MGTIEWCKQALRDLQPISEQTGQSPWQLFVRFEICKHAFGATLENFKVLRMYEANLYTCSQYMTGKKRARLMRYLNSNATPEDYEALNNKFLLARDYADLFHRQTLYTPEATPEQIREFISRKDAPSRFCAKEVHSMQGKDVVFYDKNTMDTDAFFQDIAGKDILLEDCIQQHPAMAELHPASVNTIRVLTVRHHGEVMIAGCTLRVGRDDASWDNFHHGGVGYPLDVDGGFVTRPGKDTHGIIYNRHPSTGRVILGFQVPHWDKVIALCKEAAMRSANINYVAWDVAVLPDGAAIVEANVKHPDVCIMQLWGPGIWRDILAFIGKKKL